MRVGTDTDPSRGFYHPPESIEVENTRVPIGRRTLGARVHPIPAQTTYDIWAYGVCVYEAIAGTPLQPYACRGKRPMTTAEVSKIGMWDDSSLRRALKAIPDNPAAHRLKLTSRRERAA